MKGTVTKSTGSWYRVRSEDGRDIDCRIRGKFRLVDKRITNPIAVGDKVEITDEDPYVIEVLEERENYIIRKSVKKKAQGHMIASNIDQAVLMVTMKKPRTSLGFIDRFLISAESFRIPQVLIFNKIDLLSNRDEEQQEEVINLYENIGVRCLKISVLEEKGLDQVYQILEGKLSLLSGHSGTGKSSLLNILHPDIAQKTKIISEFSEKGTHTTTFAEMFFLNEETRIIDTPGIKELGLLEMEPFEIGDYFPEIREVRENCKFNNCLHISEPGCAVREAVDQGQINPLRYKSYLSMLEDRDNRR